MGTDQRGDPPTGAGMSENEHVAAIRRRIVAHQATHEGDGMTRWSRDQEDYQAVIDHADALARDLSAERETATRLRRALIEMATVYLHSGVMDRAIRRGTIRNVLATNRVADQVGLDLGDIDAGWDGEEGGGA